jgi:hypothetical protein
LSNLNPPKVRLNSQNETATAPNGPCPGPTSEPLRLPSHSLAADAIPHELARPSLPLRRTALDPPRCRPPTQGSRVRFSVARSHVRLRLPSASVVQVVPVTMMHRGILQPRLADGGRLTQSQGWGKRKRHGRARAGPAHQNFFGPEKSWGAHFAHFVVGFSLVVNPSAFTRQRAIFGSSRPHSCSFTHAINYSFRDRSSVGERETEVGRARGNGRLRLED